MFLLGLSKDILQSPLEKKKQLRKLSSLSPAIKIPPAIMKVPPMRPIMQKIIRPKACHKYPNVLFS